MPTALARAANPRYPANAQQLIGFADSLLFNRRPYESSFPLVSPRIVMAAFPNGLTPTKIVISHSGILPERNSHREPRGTGAHNASVMPADISTRPVNCRSSTAAKNHTQGQRSLASALFWPT